MFNHILDICAIDIDSPTMQSIERFVIELYSANMEVSSVNLARQELFSHGKVQFDGIPPTLAALFEHTLRAILQACYFWGQCLVTQQVVPKFDRMGWQFSQTLGVWVPLWSKLDDMSHACSLISHCVCKKGCQLNNNCGCRKAGFRCSTICACRGACCNNAS